MEKLMTRRRTDCRGFTLLELLMVVIIIAILASIALPQYLKATEKARAAEALQVLGAMRSAAARFRSLDPNSAWPTAVEDLDVEPPISVDWTYSMAGTEAVATRAGGNFGGDIHLDFDTGALTGSFAPFCGTDGVCP